MACSRDAVGVECWGAWLVFLVKVAGFKQPIDGGRKAVVKAVTDRFDDLFGGIARLKTEID